VGVGVHHSEGEVGAQAAEGELAVETQQAAEGQRAVEEQRALEDGKQALDAQVVKRVQAFEALAMEKDEIVGKVHAMGEAQGP
jgi:hypothetical protein